MTRKFTNKIMDLVDEGVLDADYLMRQLLMWMSEDDVREYYRANLQSELECDEDDE